MVRFLLVTTDDEGKRLGFHFAVAAVANSFERREVEGADPPRATINYVVDDQHLTPFLAVAREVGVTVEEIEPGDEETYTLLVGEPGTGWVRS